MRVGIVGSEALKFTSSTEATARDVIRKLLQRPGVEAVISGACHLGGVDVFAIEEGRKLGIATIEYPPTVLSWEQGYKPRNIAIANNSDEVYCVTVDVLPKGYNGMQFEICYHCGTRTHVKSGGCWTVKYARRTGRRTAVYVVCADGSVRIER